MSCYNFDYVRRHYDVPTDSGRRVTSDGEPDVLIVDRANSSTLP